MTPAPNNKMILQCQNITRTYMSGETELTVLRDLSMAAHENEFIAVTGESGCGKSTLLHALGCLDHVNQGEIYYKDTAYSRLHSIEQDRMRNREFGFVFQFHYLLPEFNAIENIMLPGMISRRSNSELRQQAETLLEELHLTERGHHKPSQLSGGEQQRVAVARALINQPVILFMDEPTGNLDPAKSHQLIELILEQRKRKNLTIIMVTHNYDIAALADRRFELMSGRLTQIN